MTPERAELAAHRGKAVYGSRPTKRRRTKAEVEKVRRALYEALEKDHPMTVRQVFYRLVSAGVIAKTEQEYKGTVDRLLIAMRRSGDIPFAWIADNTRWMRKPRTWSSLEEALRHTADTYRRSLWDNQDVYVEVWTEKDALAGVLIEETRRWDVPLMVSRGFSSISYLYEAAAVIQAEDRPAFLYYFGDHDPSGVHIDRNIERQLRQLAPAADIHFERVAVRPEQIEAWGLPTRPTKRTDSRSKNFVGDSVEVDAIPPQRLRRLVRERIEVHVDRRALEVQRVAEENEREMLTLLCDGMAKAGRQQGPDQSTEGEIP
jgi:hypothetical protein